MLRELRVTVAGCFNGYQVIRLTVVQHHFGLPLERQVDFRGVVKGGTMRATSAYDASESPTSVQEERGKCDGTALRKASDVNLVMHSIQALDFFLD